MKFLERVNAEVLFRFGDFDLIGEFRGLIGLITFHNSPLNYPNAPTFIGQITNWNLT